MKLNFVTAFVLALALQANAGEYPKATSPEVVEKNFEAMHRLERDYEIGRSSFNIYVDCQETKEAAEKAVASKATAIQLSVDAAIAALGLGERNETLNYNFDNSTSSNASNPVANTLDAKKGQYFWTNRCTGEQSDSPVRAKNVWSAAKSISVWFPNKGKVLNDLSALVTQVEALSEKGTTGVKVACNSSAGTNYDLDVTESTAKAAWSEIEKVAKERAEEKVRAEFAVNKYDQVWAGAESFQQGGMTRLPRPSVEKEKGQWIAKLSETRNYSVYYKQSSETETKPGQLTDKKTYSVTADTTTKSGLYGTLNIRVSKQCADSKRAAEAEVSVVGNEILAKLREINQGKSSETDRLEVKDAAGQQYSPLAQYNQIVDKQTVTFYYNTCTLEKYEVESEKRPDIQAWEGSQQLVITSSDLDALATLRDALDKKYAREIEDPSAVSVSVGWSATAALAVLETLGSQLEVDAAQKFLAKNSEFQCDAGKFSFACLTNVPVRHYESADFSERGMAKAAAYSDAAPLSDVDASERGVKTFVGKYVKAYTVRKVLVDDKR